MPGMKRLRSFSVCDLVRQVILGWLLAVTMEFLLLSGSLRDLAKLEGLAQMSLGRVLLITCAVSVLLFSVSRFWNTAAGERWCIAGIFCVLAIATLQASFTWAFLLACILLFAVLAIFAHRGWASAPAPVAPIKKANPVYLWVTVILSGLFFLFVCAWTVGRVTSFSAPSYDFGIFSQMFYHMKESGLPMTTLERDGLLSHFAVHVSPIYYLLLPFYCLAPTPATLQVLQAAVITSSVIPLWKICKHHGLSGLPQVLVCVLLLLYPAFSGGTSYDIHENCFLAPLLLWLFYGIDRKNTAITAVAALLTLTVKEDAAVYVAVISLWLIVKTLLRFQKSHRKDLLTGILMLAVSILWFFLVTGYLAKHGDGVMTYRYSNFIYDGSASLVTVIKAVVLSPMKALYECVDPEKLGFIALTLLPLLGLPLLTRRYERYLLLIPYVLVNLMSDYQYQHDIFFQYTFGSTACLLYLTAVNLADISHCRIRILALATAAAVSLVCFSTTVFPKAKPYPQYSIRYYSYYQGIRDTLDTIPADASVTAATFYTTHLSQRDTLYDLRYASKEHVLQTQYVAISISADGDFQKYATPGQKDGFENLIKFLTENGYTVYAELPDVLVIYAKQPA